MVCSLEKEVEKVQNVFLIDTCALQDISLDAIRENPELYFIPQHIINEFYKWSERERKPELGIRNIDELPDGRNKAVRPGYIHAYDVLFEKELKLDDMLRETQDPEKKAKLEMKKTRAALAKEQILSEYAEFFEQFKQCADVVRYFEDNAPEQIIIGSTNPVFERYSNLLTKKIATDMLTQYQAYRHCFEQGFHGRKGQARLRKLAQQGVKEYKRRLGEFGLLDEANSKLANAEKEFKKAFSCMHQKYSAGNSIPKVIGSFEHSLRKDISTAFAAYTFKNRFSNANNVNIVTRDKDISELVYHINLAKKAGQLNGQYSNNVLVLAYKQAGGRR